MLANMSLVLNVSDATDLTASPFSDLNNQSDLGNASSTSENMTEAPRRWPVRDEYLAKIEIGIIAAVFSIIVFGNICVLIALRLRKKKLTRMHFFVLHLSIADLWVGIFCILPQLLWKVTFQFQGPDFLCRLVKYLQVFAMYLSTYVLVMTAIDRYQAICHPLSTYKWSPRRVYFMVGVAYVLAAMFSLPMFIEYGIYERPGYDEFFDCYWPYDGDHIWKVQAYVTWFTLSVFFIPTSLLAFCYGRISCVICLNVQMKTTKARDKHDGNETNGRPAASDLNPRTSSVKGVSKAKVKTIKLTFIVVFFYVVCWSPWFTAQIWSVYDPTNTPRYKYFFPIVMLMASLNSCINPWIYMAFTGIYKQLYYAACCRMKKLRALDRASTVSKTQASFVSQSTVCEPRGSTSFRLSSVGRLSLTHRLVGDDKSGIPKNPATPSLLGQDSGTAMEMTNSSCKGSNGAIGDETTSMLT